MTIEIQPFNNFKKTQSGLKRQEKTPSTEIGNSLPATKKHKKSELGSAQIALIATIATCGLAAGYKGIKSLKSLFNSKEAKQIATNSNIAKRLDITGFTEITRHIDEVKKISDRTSAKFQKKQFDIDYYKDEFRLDMIAAEKLKSVRETSDPKFKAIFENKLNRNQFMLSDGYMIHGKNEAEKKKLLNHFINEGKKHEFDVVHIPGGDTDGVKFCQNVAELFPKAKEKYLKEKKHTMFVIENVDKLLHLDLKNEIGGIGTGPINTHTHKCGENGVMWLSTAKDFSKLNDSSVRGGRIKFKIDLDKALELGKKGMQ